MRTKQVNENNHDKGEKGTTFFAITQTYMKSRQKNENNNEIKTNFFALFYYFVINNSNLFTVMCNFFNLLDFRQYYML